MVEFDNSRTIENNFVRKEQVVPTKAKLNSVFILPFVVLMNCELVSNYLNSTKYALCILGD